MWHKPVNVGGLHKVASWSVPRGVRERHHLEGFYGAFRYRACGAAQRGDTMAVQYKKKGPDHGFELAHRTRI